MSSWWRKIAELQGSTQGVGSWKRRAVLGAGATGNGSSWPRIAATSLGTQQDNGSWTRRLVPPGALAPSWSRALYESGGLVEPFSPHSLALFEAMEVQPDDARKAVIDTFILALVAAGVWDLLDALYIFAAHTEQAALLNWVAPGTFDATAVSVLTFTSDEGFTGDGAAAYIDTAFNPATAASPKFVQDSACVFAWSLSAGQDAGGLIGTTSSAANETCVLYPRYTDNNTYTKVNQSADSVFASMDGSGLWTMVRRASDETEYYRNGVSIATDTEASVAPNNSNIFVMRRGTTFFAGQAACAGIGAQLTAAEQLALYDAGLVYMQTVGAVA